MSILTVDAFESVVGSGMDASRLQDIIDRVEAQLAHDLGGPLIGPRTETLYPGVGYDGPVYLRRYAAAVTVTDAGSDVADVRLVEGGGAIERAGGAWQGAISVTYVPDDWERVLAALIEMVRDVVVPDTDREAGASRDERDAIARRRRRIILRDLRPTPRHGTIAVGPSYRLTRPLG